MWTMSCWFITLHFFFFFNDTATTEIYTLSLHDALPIFHITGTKLERSRFKEFLAGNTGLQRAVGVEVFLLEKTVGFVTPYLTEAFSLVITVDIAVLRIELRNLLNNM